MIIFHELGHFLVAKACNVQVNEFCIGFGPEIVGFKKGETRYSIKLLWLGGACVMEGEDDDSTNPRAFNNKKAWQRLLISVAGPLFNIILAFVASIILLSASYTTLPVISRVMEGSPAEEAGLTSGDEIKSIAGYNLHFFNEIAICLYFNHDDIKVEYLRDGELQTTTLNAAKTDSGRYVIGVVSGMPEKLKGANILKYSFYEMKYQIYMTIESLKMLFTGGVKASDLSGPVGIVDTIGDVYEESAVNGAISVILNMLNMLILLSVNLGIMNLLPVPALDGGRILFIIVEMIRGKKIDEDLEGKIHVLGFALLMLLMFYVMYNDIIKIIVGR